MSVSVPDPPLDKCPHWCVEDHSAQLHPDDQRHLSASVLVQVIARPRSSIHPDAVPHAEELGIVVHRSIGGFETWLAIASEAQALEVSLESARRLVHALAEVLEAVSGY